MWTDTYGTIIQKKLSSREKASIILKNSLIVFMKVRIKELSVSVSRSRAVIGQQK